MAGRAEPPPGLPSWAVVAPRRLDHIRRVAEVAGGWAGRMGVPDGERHRWLAAVWLHDALRDAPEAELRRWAPEFAGPVELLHGPAAAARAQAGGLDDAGILDAVRYHSVGWPGWNFVGRMLYCADFLEPGRRFDAEARAELAARFPDDPEGVVLETARRRLLHAVRSGWAIPEASYRFWNSLAARRPDADR